MTITNAGLRGQLADLIESTMPEDVAIGVVEALEAWWRHEAPNRVDWAIRDIVRAVALRGAVLCVLSEVRDGHRCLACGCELEPGDRKHTTEVGPTRATTCGGCHA